MSKYALDMGYADGMAGNPQKKMSRAGEQLCYNQGYARGELEKLQSSRKMPTEPDLEIAAEEVGMAIGAITSWFTPSDEQKVVLAHLNKALRALCVEHGDIPSILDEG